jgi:hypothetical protein
MIVFFGDSENDVRAAKLEALKGHFKENDAPVAVRMLKEGALSGSKSSKEKLIVSYHGSRETLAGKSAEELFGIFLSKGLTNKRFEAVYLMACNVGEQAQDNSIIDNFAKDFRRCVTQNDGTAGIVVYAPRGVLVYEIGDERIGETSEFKKKVRRIYVICENNGQREEYTLETGLMQVMM